MDISNQIKGAVQLFLSQIGISSPQEILINSEPDKINLHNLSIFAISLSSVVTGLHASIEEFVYKPALGVYILFVITLVQTWVKASVAVEENKSHTISKILRLAVARIAFQMLLVGTVFEMSKVWHYLFQAWTVDSLLLIFIISTFWSSIRNAAKINLISEDQYKMIEGVINLKSILKKLKNKK